jgi:hypothetical protein
MRIGNYIIRSNFGEERSSPAVVVLWPARRADQQAEGEKQDVKRQQEQAE